MLGIVGPIQKRSKDQYRPLFCEASFYRAHQELFVQWNHLFRNLTSVEKVQAWVCALSLLRRPEDWFGGRRKNPLRIASKNLLHPLQLNQITNLSAICIPPKLDPNLNLFDFLNQVLIKALPESCMRSLVQMSDQTYPLVVLQTVPTPQQLLKFQLKNERVISFHENFETWPNSVYHGRDFLSFIIHDLIHADHFFALPQYRCGQLGFYRCIKMILDEKHLLNFLKNETFKKAFDYIISDMNSHPVHLLKTLHARLLHSCNDENQLNTVWNDWTQVWSSEDFTTYSALQKINTQLFSSNDALRLTDWCIALGRN